MDPVSKVDQFGTLVRPIVTLAFSGAVVYGFVTSHLSADAFLGIAATVITFWFQGRTVDKVPPPAPPTPPDPGKP